MSVMHEWLYNFNLTSNVICGSGGSSRQPGKGSSAPSSSAPPKTTSGDPTEEDVARAFSVYDRDGTGEVSVLDLQGTHVSFHHGCMHVGILGHDMTTHPSMEESTLS